MTPTKPTRRPILYRRRAVETAAEAKARRMATQKRLAGTSGAWWRDRILKASRAADDFQAQYFKHLAGRAAEPQATDYQISGSEAEQLRQSAREQHAAFTI